MLLNMRTALMRVIHQIGDIATCDKIIDMRGSTSGATKRLTHLGYALPHMRASVVYRTDATTEDPARAHFR